MPSARRLLFAVTAVKPNHTRGSAAAAALLGEDTGSSGVDAHLGHIRQQLQQLEKSIQLLKVKGAQVELSDVAVFNVGQQGRAARQPLFHINRTDSSASTDAKRGDPSAGGLATSPSVEPLESPNSSPSRLPPSPTSDRSRPHLYVETAPHEEHASLANSLDAASASSPRKKKKERAGAARTVVNIDEAVSVSVAAAARAKDTRRRRPIVARSGDSPIAASSSSLPSPHRGSSPAAAASADRTKRRRRRIPKASRVSSPMAGPQQVRFVGCVWLGIVRLGCCLGENEAQRTFF